MFIRQKFVTNSSSTSFIAWGLIVPVDENKEKEIDFLEAYRGSADAAARRDGLGHYLIYAKMSIIDTEEYNTTVALDSQLTGGKIIGNWTTVVQTFATELGLDIENIKPSWFFTRYET